MKKHLFAISALSACLFLSAFAGPVDDLKAGQDMDFRLNGGLLKLSGAISDRITIDPRPPIAVPKNPGTLNITLDLETLLGIPGLPDLNLRGRDIGNNQVQWRVNQTLNFCLDSDVSGLPVDVLIKTVKGKLTAQTTSITPFFDPVTNQTVQRLLRGYWWQYIKQTQHRSLCALRRVPLHLNQRQGEEP